MDAIYERNQGIMLELDCLASWLGLQVASYHSSSRMGAYQGCVRYALYRGDKRPYGTRSKLVVAWEQAPFQKNYHPSNVGERRALLGLLATVKSMAAA